MQFLEEEKKDHRNIAKEAKNDGICYVCCTAIERESDLYVTQTCKHAYHKLCIFKTLETFILQRHFPIRCTREECFVTIELPEAQQIV